LLTICSQSYATLIFQFDNAEIPEIDFVGVESTNVHLYFGPDLLDIGDSFDLLIGITPGSNELASALNVHFDLDDISGFGFGGALELTPSTEQFFVTIMKTSGSFNVSEVSAYFINHGEGASFHGVAQRPVDTIDVPEPKSILLLLLALVFLWPVIICNTYHNA
jgi:hypothetical protein